MPRSYRRTRRFRRRRSIRRKTMRRTGSRRSVRRFGRRKYGRRRAGFRGGKQTFPNQFDFILNYVDEDVTQFVTAGGAGTELGTINYVPGALWKFAAASALREDFPGLEEMSAMFYAARVMAIKFTVTVENTSTLDCINVGIFARRSAATPTWFEYRQAELGINRNNLRWKYVGVRDGGNNKKTLSFYINLGKLFGSKREFMAEEGFVQALPPTANPAQVQFLQLYFRSQTAAGFSAAVAAWVSVKAKMYCRFFRRTALNLE